MNHIARMTLISDLTVMYQFFPILQLFPSSKVVAGTNKNVPVWNFLKIISVIIVHIVLKDVGIIYMYMMNGCMKLNIFGYQLTFINVYNEL